MNVGVKERGGGKREAGRDGERERGKEGATESESESETHTEWKCVGV